MLLFIATIADDEVRSKLETIYNRHSKAMFNHAYVILKNTSDAEDAVQEAFIRLYKNVNKIKDANSIETRRFAIIISRNCAIDLYRKKKRLKEAEFNEEELLASTLDFDIEVKNQLTKSILTLQPRYRDALLLRYVHGLDYADLARCMNISYDNARKLLQRAKDKLETICKERGLL